MSYLINKNRNIINIRIKYKLSRLYETLKYYIVSLFFKTEKDHIWVVSSGIAFNLLICVVPFILILLTILGIYIGSSNALEQLNTYLNTVVPFPEPYKEKLIKQIVERSNELSSNTFLTGVIGIMALLWTMSGLFGTMRDVINRIFEVSESINYLLHKLRDFLVVIITFLLFIISLSFTSVYNLIQTYSLNILGNTFTFTFFEKILQFIIVFLISFILYYILYSYIPHFKYPKKVVLYMSIIAGFFTELLNYFFTLYVLKFSNFGKIYGTYAALAIFIFWIYYLSVIFVMTAEWGYVYILKNNLKIILRKKNKSNGI